MPKEIRMIDMRNLVSDPLEVIEQMRSGDLQVELFLDGARFDGQWAFLAIAGDPGQIQVYARDEKGHVRIDWQAQQPIVEPPVIGKVEIKPRVAQLADLQRKEG